MDAPLDIRSGELYLFPYHSPNSVYEYHGTVDGDRLLFVCKTDPSTLRLHREQFEELRSRPNGIVRVRPSGADASESFAFTDPATFLDLQDPSLSERQRQRIGSLKKDRMWAQTVQFYTEKYDGSSGVSLSEMGLAGFIADHAAEAVRLGLAMPISASTLRRAIRDRGAPGDRALNYFTSEKAHKRSRNWDPFILRLKAELISDFWNRRRPRLSDVQDTFYRKLRDKNNELASLCVEELTAPTKETLRLWIKEAECYERYKARYGGRAASRRFRGQRQSIRASRPLEYVMFDHTRVDAWANVENEDGKAFLQERPWLMLAVDAFSRLILAAVLTYEPPSIYTVAMCLKQLVRPKDFLPSDLRGYKNFDDGWGKPSYIVVDNGWENTEVSFQTMCESAGINIIWAPVRTPEFKSHVEHCFHLLNSIYWHRLPSGIPHKPHVMAQLNLNPRKEADRSIGKMSDGLWYAIRKVALSTNDGLGMAPARAWKEGIEKHGRPMIDNVSAFDTFLGKVRQCQLSTSGVKLEGQRFHNPAITTALLNDLLRYAKASTQRKAAHSSGTVHVHVTMDPSTCEYIYVWNPRAQRNIKLPNIRPRFSTGLSWQEAKTCREYATKQNLAFCTDEEMLDVSRALMATYETQAKKLPFREARKIARRYRSGTRLVPATVVEEVWEDPSATGLGPAEIPNSLAARGRKDARKVIKSARRGGSAASKKAAKKRKENRKLRGESVTATFQDKSSGSTTPSKKTRNEIWGEVTDPSALLNRLSRSI